jgi:large subunit ribosomal protein L3
MTIGLVGRKCGMTRIFNELGESIPVTVLEVLPNKIVQIKTGKTDGYQAIQVTFGERRKSRLTKPLLNHYAKAEVMPGVGLWEFRLSLSEDLAKRELSVGSILTVELFHDGQFVDVRGVSKGKGFAGVIKRYHFSAQDMTHGNSLSHRAPGSIGQRQTPGRVFKGKKMAGHLGNKRRTVQNQRIVQVDKEKNLLLIRGAVSGAPGGIVVILPASKKRLKGE